MKNLGLFFREVRVELGKVIWPGKDEFFGAFVVVLITMVLFTLFFALVNNVFYAGALKGYEYFVFGRH